jgi:hypothetical protein
MRQSMRARAESGEAGTERHVRHVVCGGVDLVESAIGTERPARLAGAGDDDRGFGRELMGGPRKIERAAVRWAGDNV